MEVVVMVLEIRDGNDDVGLKWLQMGLQLVERVMVVCNAGVRRVLIGPSLFGLNYFALNSITRLSLSLFKEREGSSFL